MKLTLEPFVLQVIKQHVARIQNMLKSVLGVVKFIDYCFQWESPLTSFLAFMVGIELTGCRSLKKRNLRSGLLGDRVER